MGTLALVLGFSVKVARREVVEAVGSREEGGELSEGRNRKKLT